MNLLMDDVLLATIPVVAILFLFQRVFVQGIVVSGSAESRNQGARGKLSFVL